MISKIWTLKFLSNYINYSHTNFEISFSLLENNGGKIQIHPIPDARIKSYIAAPAPPPHRPLLPVSRKRRFQPRILPVNGTRTVAITQAECGNAFAPIIVPVPTHIIA